MYSNTYIGRGISRALLYVASLAAGAATAYATSPHASLGAGARVDAASAAPKARARPTAPTAPSVGATAAAAAAAPSVAPHLPEVAAVEPIPEPEAEAWDGLGAALRGGKIITGSTPHRLVLFTFDDGPDRRTTPLLLDRLDDEGIKAIFFLVGSRIAGTNSMERQQAAIAREIVRRGHLVGNHTIDHVQLPLLDDEAVRAELTGAETIFERVLGGRPWLFRPPFGAHSQRIDQHLASRGYTTVLWNLGSGDFQVRSAEEVFDTWLKVFERREREEGERGGIILLHDTYAWSVDAFQLIVTHLQQRNCELLREGQELYDIIDDPAPFFVPRDGESAEAEAPPAELDSRTLAARQQQLADLTERRCRSLASL
ncbi:MAG: polysaccharide deacetylase family protein [Myxococcales bacterium]|nr:polysaccharide deacetylase family protein [Myxococcales bacterium]